MHRGSAGGAPESDRPEPVTCRAGVAARLRLGFRVRGLGCGAGVRGGVGVGVGVAGGVPVGGGLGARVGKEREGRAADRARGIPKRVALAW